MVIFPHFPEAKLKAKVKQPIEFAKPINIKLWLRVYWDFLFCQFTTLTVTDLYLLDISFHFK